MATATEALAAWALAVAVDVAASTGWAMVEDPHPWHISLATGFL